MYFLRKAFGGLYVDLTDLKPGPMMSQNGCCLAVVSGSGSKVVSTLRRTIFRSIRLYVCHTSAVMVTVGAASLVGT